MKKRVIVTGGTGFIGRVLCRRLLDAGYEVVVLSRDPSRVAGLIGGGAVGVAWDGRHCEGWLEQAEGSYGIVNLAGRGIASGRWTDEVKESILNSRTAAGRAVSEAVRQVSRRPEVLVQASAIGYYGDGGEAVIDESSPNGRGFLAGVAAEWEQSTAGVESLGIRRVIIRTAVVLGRGGGFLGRIVPQFRRFLGGIPGSGINWLSWIHLDDEVSAILHLLDHEDLGGTFNLSAPEPVRSGEFYRALGKALGRPVWIPVPAFALRLALGEMADELMLYGQRALPHRLIDSGFAFGYRSVTGAFERIFNR